MKRIFSIVISVVLLPFMGSSQHLELGMNIGASNYWGDLAPDIALNETHPCYGFFARVNLSSSFAFTTSLNTLTISGNDQNFEVNKRRNINVMTPISEISTIVEFNFFRYGVDVLDKKFSPYVFTGVAFTSFDPQAKVGNSYVHLRNIRTENVSYPNTVLSLPFGMGFKWQFHRHFACDFSVHFRRVNSDYLDDVSTVYIDNNQAVLRKGGIGAYLADPSSGRNDAVPLFSTGDRRGNQDYTDWYVSSTISISYRFYKRSKCRRFY